MSTQKIEKLIVDYMDGTLSREGEQQLLALLQKEGRKITSLEDLKELELQLDKLTEAEPTEILTVSFHRKLNQKAKPVMVKKSHLSSIRDWLQTINYRKLAIQLAFAFILLWCGWIFGQRNQVEIGHLRGEVSQMKGMFSIAMLKDSSPSGRIQALHFISGFDRLDGRLRNAVSRLLQRDPNVNVRLIALETLMRYADDEQVRNELLLAIEKQNEPLMQIAITEAMTELKEDRAVAGLYSLLNRRDLNFMVREMIEKSINKLT